MSGALQAVFTNLRSFLGPPAFATSMGDSQSFSGKSVARDSAGNFFVASSRSNNTGAFTNIAKYSRLGVIQWQNNYDVNSSALCSIAIDLANDTLFVCVVKSPNQVVILKLANSNGAVTAQTRFTTPRVDYIGEFAGSNLAVDSSGNVIFCTGGRVAITNVDEMFIVKLNSSLTQSWQRLIPNAAARSLEPKPGVITDASNNIYVCGTILNGGYDKAYIAKLNSSGTFQWGRRLDNSGAYGGESNTGSLKSMVVDSAGDVYAVGLITMSSGTFLYLVKYNSSGTFQWERMLSGTSQLYGINVSIDSSNNLYIVANGSEAIAGGYIVKYNSSGTLQWQRNIDSSDSTVTFGAFGSTYNTPIDTPQMLFNSFTTSTFRTLLMSVPPDGSRTGTFTVSGVTYLYSASSLSAPAPATTKTNEGSATTPTKTQDTPSFTASGTSLTTNTVQLP